METIENNKLIAKFMGGLLRGEGRLSLRVDEIWLPIHGTCHLGQTGKSLKYDTSWDWLIPVIEKIKTVTNIENYFDIVGLEQRLNPFNYDIHSIYKGVVEFIKWYNDNKLQ